MNDTNTERRVCGGWPEPYTHMHIQCVLKCLVAVKLTYVQSLLKLARTIYIRLYTLVLAGKSPNIRSYTVYIWSSGHP